MYGIYTHVPKTGGTAITKVLENECGFLPLRKILHLRRRIQRHIIFKGDCSITVSHANVRAMLKRGLLTKQYYQNALKFCFVRNPYDRFVSVWRHHRSVKGKHYERMSIENFEENVRNKVEDIKHVKKPGSCKSPKGAFWLPQVCFIPEDMDYVGRFEELQTSFDAVMRMLGLPERTLPYERVYNRGERWQEYYRSQEIKNLVTEMYAEDFERFGYPIWQGDEYAG